jgi:hypothetical protein
MKGDQFNKLLAFLERLDQAKIPYTMRHSRDDAVMVVVYAPGQYWEIDFIADGDIDIERYRSDGHIDDESVLEELFALWAEPEPTTPEAVKQDGTTPRK